MVDRRLRLYQILCAALFAAAALQASSFFSEKDPLGDDDALEILPPSAPPPSSSSTSGDAKLPPLPEIFRRIETGGLFGTTPAPAEEKPADPVLLGVIGKHAMVLAPNGQTCLLSEGSELLGIKLLKLATNRALIEHLGKQKELTIFSGLGTGSLLPPDPPSNLSKPAAPSEGRSSSKDNDVPKAKNAQKD